MNKFIEDLYCSYLKLYLSGNLPQILGRSVSYDTARTIITNLANKNKDIPSLQRNLGSLFPSVEIKMNPLNYPTACKYLAKERWVIKEGDIYYGITINVISTNGKKIIVNP